MNAGISAAAAPGIEGAAPPTSVGTPSEQDIFATVGLLWGEWRLILSDLIHLAGLEARQAGLSFSLLVSLALWIAVLTASAWFCLIAAIAILSVQAGANWALALFAVVLVNLLLALALIAWSRRLSDDLLFRATADQVGGGVLGPRQ
jgi:hypothetical protein